MCAALKITRRGTYLSHLRNRNGKWHSPSCLLDYPIIRLIIACKVCLKKLPHGDFL